MTKRGSAVGNPQLYYCRTGLLLLLPYVGACRVRQGPNRWRGASLPIPRRKLAISGKVQIRCMQVRYHGSTTAHSSYLTLCSTYMHYTQYHMTFWCLSVLPNVPVPYMTVRRLADWQTPSCVLLVVNPCYKPLDSGAAPV